MAAQPSAAPASPSSSLGAWGLVALAAVVAHLPALRGYFFQDDWPHLARVLGHISPESWPARPLSRIWGFRAGHALADMHASAWHATALLAWALACVIIVRLARRTGLGTFGAIIAGLVAAGTPAVVIPVFWASAAAEIFATLLALLALDFWTQKRRGSAALAVGFGLTSFFTKESALVALPVMIALWSWARGPERGRGPKLTAGGVFVLSLGALAAATLIWQAMGPHSPYDPYAMGGIRLWLMNLAALGAWLASPFHFLPLSTAALPWWGLGVWTAWFFFALWRLRRGERMALWWWSWALFSLIPVLPLVRHLQPYYLLAAIAGWGWTLGRVAELLWPRSGGRARRRNVVLAAVAALVAFAAFTSTQSLLSARNPRGGLRNPLAERSAIAFEVHRLVRSLPLEPGETLAVLAATYTQWPKQIPAAQAQRINSRIYAAIDGPVGLSIMVPDSVKVRWDSHLDGLRGDSLVLFDDGGPRLRFWGRLANARFYSALVAEAAGQYQRALHDLWVVGGGGTRHDFVYDPQLLPILPENLDENAQEFLHYILQHEEDPQTASRLVMLFQQLYETVRGKSLRLEPLPSDQG